jgi:hypothetical protein
MLARVYALCANFFVGVSVYVSSFYDKYRARCGEPVGNLVDEWMPMGTMGSVVGQSGDRWE